MKIELKKKSSFFLNLMPKCKKTAINCPEPVYDIEGN